MEDPVVESVESDVERLERFFTDYVDTFNDNDVEAMIDADYVDGNQLTEEERAVLQKRKQPDVVFNRVLPKVNFLVGFQQQNRTDPKAFGRNGVDQMSAEAATHATRFVGDANNWGMQQSWIWDEGVVYGYSCAEIVKKPRSDKIELNWVRWDRSFYDPYARRPDLSDRRYAGQAIWVDFDVAQRKYGVDIEPDSDGATSEKFEDQPIWIDRARKRVRIIEMYLRESNDVVFRYLFTRGKVISKKKSIYLDDEGESIDPYEFFVCYMDRKGRPYGVVRNWRDPQDEVNKRRSKALHLLNVRQIRVTKGGVDDVEETRRELTKPDGVVVTNEKDGLEILSTTDMSQGNLVLLQEAKQEIDSVGVNPALAGKETNVVSGRALDSRKASGATEITPIITSFTDFQRRVFTKVWYCVKQFWTAAKWIRVTDDELNPRFIQLNAGLDNELGKIDVDILMGETDDTMTLAQQDLQELGNALTSFAPNNPALGSILLEGVIEAYPMKNRVKERLLKRLRGEFDTEEEAQSAQINQLMAQKAAQLELQAKEMEIVEARAKAEERIFMAQLKAAKLRQEGLLGLAEIEKDLIIAGEQTNRESLRTNISAVRGTALQTPREAQ